MNGVDLFYCVAGKGPPLLLLHGLTGTGSIWERFLPDFASSFTVIMPDLRGHGRSTNPDGHFSHAEVARDMFQLMDRLGFARFRVIGFSAGGMAAIRMALQQPARVEALVVLGAGHRVTDAILREWRESPEFAKFPAEVRDYWRSVHPGGEAQVNSIFGSARSLGADAESVNLTLEQLRTIPANALIVLGDRDGLPLEIALELYRGIRGSQLWVVPGHGHYFLWKEFGGSDTAIRIFPAVVQDFFRSAAKQDAAK